MHESWFIHYWRPAAAWVYLIICIFDFMIMPVWHLRSQGSLNNIYEISMRLRPEDQLQAIVQLAKRTSWEPITVSDGSMFHLSFGAILGVAAWTRGRVEAMNKNGSNNVDDPNSVPPTRPPQG
jgi:hypothetical protein